MTTPSGTATNILNMREEFVFQSDARFVPNVYEGIGMNYDSEWHEITLTFDSDTDIFDAFINDTGANTALGSLVIQMTTIVIATETEVTETWTYTGNSIWVMDRPRGEIEENRERKPFEYQLLAYNDKTVVFS